MTTHLQFYATNSRQRINLLIDQYSEGGFEAARITERDTFYYTTELEDIGPMYIMNDFGDAIMVTSEMSRQKFVIYPPLNALT
jgi:hypothetical protein